MSEERLPLQSTELTVTEQEVVDAAHRGVWVGPEDGCPTDLTVTGDAGVHVRAGLIRELLMGLHGQVDPRGVRLRGVRLVGELDLDRVSTATGLSLTQCAIPDGFTCDHARLPWLNLNGSLLSYLNASGLSTEDDLSMRQVIAHGDRRTGVIRLLNAHIRGVVSLNGAKIANDSGPAVFADGLRTDSTLFLNEATMSGVGEKGAVCLLSAHIGGPAELRHTKITNHSGPALHADRLRTDSTLFLNGATIRGARKHGALRLPGAHIGGQLNMVDTLVINDSGLLMTLNEMTVTGKLIFPATAVCPHGRPDSGNRTCPDGNRQIAVRDLTFPRLDDATWQQWLHLLVHHTAVYRSQPFQQLAAVERAAGHDSSARQILITQQDDLRRRTPQALGGRLGRQRHQLWGWLGRYGYRAHRLVVALFVVVALSGGMAYLAGQIPTRPGHHAAERVTTPAATPATGPGVPCSTAELLGLGIDRGLPVGTTGLRARCDLDTTTHLGQAFTYALWALQAMLWALATLAAAAYTGLVRKPT